MVMVTSKTLFDAVVVDEVISRINFLTPVSQRLRGKMSVDQMLEHCALALDMAMGKTPTKRAFLWYIFGWIAKRSTFKNEQFGKNLPSIPEVITIWNHFDCDYEKKRLIVAINEFSAISHDKIEHNVHAFFGKLTPEEWWILMYKHLDHHLRQFGV